MTRELSDYSDYHDRRFQDLGLEGVSLVGSEFHDCLFEACSFAESRFSGVPFCRLRLSGVRPEPGSDSG